MRTDEALLLQDKTLCLNAAPLCELADRAEGESELRSHLIDIFKVRMPVYVQSLGGAGPEQVWSI